MKNYGDPSNIQAAILAQQQEELEDQLRYEEEFRDFVPKSQSEILETIRKGREVFENNFEPIIFGNRERFLATERHNSDILEDDDYEQYLYESNFDFESEYNSYLESNNILTSRGFRTFGADMELSYCKDEEYQSNLESAYEVSLGLDELQDSLQVQQEIVDNVYSQSDESGSVILTESNFIEKGKAHKTESFQSALADFCDSNFSTSTSTLLLKYYSYKDDSFIKKYIWYKDDDVSISSNVDFRIVYIPSGGGKTTFFQTYGDHSFVINGKVFKLLDIDKFIYDHYESFKLVQDVCTYTNCRLLMMQWFKHSFTKYHLELNNCILICNHPNQLPNCFRKVVNELVILPKVRNWNLRFFNENYFSLGVLRHKHRVHLNYDDYLSYIREFFKVQFIFKSSKE